MAGSNGMPSAHFDRRTSKVVSEMPSPFTVLRKNLAISWHVAAHQGDFVHRDLRLSIPSTVKRDVRHMIATGNYENEEFELISKWLPADRSVIELGGCLGVVSAHLRRTIDSDRQLIIVEANPNIIETCHANACRPSPASPTTVICGAIAYGKDEVAFHIRRNLHVSHIADATAESNFISPAYTLAKITEYLRESGEFTLICDVEGCEYDLFQHDRPVLERCGLAIVETHPQMFEDGAARDAALLANAAAAGLSLVDRVADVIVLKRT